MQAPTTQEEINYRESLNNKVTAISSVMGLFTDIEDKPRRLRMLKALLAALNYGDGLNTEIDAEIAALEEKIASLEEQILKTATDFVKLNQLTGEKEETENKLEEKMDRWMYLEDLAERINNQ